MPWSRSLRHPGRLLHAVRRANGVLMGSLISIPAAVYVWSGFRDIGEGVRNAAKSACADTALRVLYQHEAETPTTIVTEAQPNGRVCHTQSRNRQNLKIRVSRKSAFNPHEIPNPSPHLS